MTTTRAIVLPRPNPGPVPLEPPSSLFPIVLGSVCAVGLVALLLAARRRRRNRPAQVLDAPTPPAPPSLETELRDRLVELFGPDWRNLTVEEIEQRGLPSETLGPEASDEVVAFIRRAERVRFSGRPEEMEANVAWVRQFLDFTAGAKSTITGK